MNKPRRTHNASGLSLLRLLFAVGLIVVIAALLYPFLVGIVPSRHFDRSLRIGSNGRQIHLALFETSLTRRHTGLPDIWPRSTDSWESSTEFLTMILTNDIIKGVDCSFFAASGVTPSTASREDIIADRGTFTPANNAWCVTLDLDEDTPANVPFLFTRNVNTGNDLTQFASDAPLNRRVKPFGNKLAVVITKGGAVKVLPEKVFKSIAVFNPTATATTAVAYQYLSPNGKNVAYSNP